MVENQQETALPEWQSHKRVRADKIVASVSESPSMTGHWDLECGESVPVSLHLAHRVPEGVNPVGGYYVLYEDGYESWSPAKAFEAGNVKMLGEDAPAPPPSYPYPGSMADINHRFTYHAPKEGQPAKYDLLRSHARALAQNINNLCSESREKSLALTKLEEAIMWANASIARNE
ncbi:MAG: hypothetical protein WC356_02375 [Candidatus Micrarchaeia archaeon]|jgi:hypothetical protein